MSKPDIQIVIANDSRTPACDAECGINWSLAESIDLARQQIKERFGEDIKLDYIDLSRPTTHPQAAKLRQQIKDKSLLLPLLVINGQSRISGLFDIRQLLDMIEVELEMGD